MRYAYGGVNKYLVFKRILIMFFILVRFKMDLFFLLLYKNSTELILGFYILHFSHGAQTEHSLLLWLSLLFPLIWINGRMRDIWKPFVR